MKTALRNALAGIFEWQMVRLIKRRRLKVVAVSGSVGKTSTKLAVAAVLKQKFRVMVEESNYNTLFGVPLSAFKLEVPRRLANPLAWGVKVLQAEAQIWGHYPYEVLVLELGTDHPGEIPHFTQYLRPDIGVITAISPEHMENFENLDAVAKEELAVLPVCKTIIADADEIARRYREKYFGQHSKYAYYAVRVRGDYGFVETGSNPLTGTTGDITEDEKVVLKGISLQVYGAHMVRRALAAYAVGRQLGLSDAELEAGLEAVTAVPGRMQPLAGPNGSTLIDDTYNSSPSAATAALASLITAPAKGRRIAVMGSMGELGNDSPRYHQEAGRAAAAVDLLVTVGDDAVQYLGPAATRAGLDPERLKPAGSPYLAASLLKPILQPGDIVLLKGSQNGVFLEEAVKLLLADPSDASRLVRQSPDWLKIKQKQFGQH